MPGVDRNGGAAPSEGLILREKSPYSVPKRRFVNRRRRAAALDLSPNVPILFPVSLEPLFHPAVAAWFQRSFPAPTAAQAEAWPAIKDGRHVLIAAPTGSGKTLAAFLAAIDGLVRQGLAGGLRGEAHHGFLVPLHARLADST